MIINALYLLDLEKKITFDSIKMKVSSFPGKLFFPCNLSHFVLLAIRLFQKEYDLFNISLFEGFSLWVIEVCREECRIYETVIW